MRNQIKYLFLFVVVFSFLSQHKALAYRGDRPTTNWEPAFGPTFTPSPADNSMTVSIPSLLSGAQYYQCPTFVGAPAVFNRLYILGDPSQIDIISGPFAGQHITINKIDNGRVGTCPTGPGDFTDMGAEARWSGSASFDTSWLPDGTYAMSLRTQMTDGGLSKTIDTSFQVRHSTPSQIHVVSKYSDGSPALTCWTFSGPDPVPSGDCNTDKFYFVNPGTFTIYPDAKSGYTLSVDRNPQTVASGGTITFNLTYSSGTGGGSGAPVCNPGSSSTFTDTNVSFNAAGGNGSFSWSAPGGTPSSGSGSTFISKWLSAGSYTVTVTSGGLNSSCIVTVSNFSSSSPGSVQVFSNIPTSWNITGPASHSEVGKTNAVYSSQPLGTYSISGVTDPIAGYNSPTITVTPSDGTLTSGGSVTFNISYTPISMPTCTDDAVLAFDTALPATIVAGTTYPIRLKVTNTGDTRFYHSVSYAWPYGIATGPSTSPELNYWGSSPLSYPNPPAFGVASGAGWDTYYDLTFAAPTTPGTYTLSWNIYEENPTTTDFYSILDSTGTPCSGGISPISPPQGKVVSFGNELVETFTVTDKGTLQVNCPTPGATWTIAPGGMTGSAPSGTYTVDPGTYTVTYGSIGGYDDSPNSTVVVTAGGTPPPATCNYTLQSLNPPVSVSIDNSVCTKVKITWTDDSTNEDGFRVMRSTTSGGPYTQISNDLAPAAGRGTVYNYTDPDNNKGGISAPAVNTTYYYVVQAFRITPSVVSPSSQVSALILPCLPNLGNSAKNLISYQKGGTGPFIAYNKDTSVVGDGDVLRFTITIVNSGSASATINYINDIMTVNLGAPTNCQVDKGSGPSACVVTPVGSNTYRINVSGSKATGGPNWVLQFDTLLTAQTTDLNEFFKNTGDINYTDAAGVHDKIVIYGPVLFKKTGSKVPTFREVSP